MHVEMRPVSEIQRYANNPRTNDHAVEAVAASIREFGFRQPIVVDKDGVILVGDTRYQAALRLGLETVPVHVDRLLEGAEIHLVNCDPPYNVKVEPRSNNAIAAGNSSLPGATKKRTHHQSSDVARQGEKKRATNTLRAKDRPRVNDFVSDAEFARLLKAWFSQISRVLLPGRSFFIWGGYANLGNYPPALKSCGLYFSQAIVWDKEHPVLTRKDMMGCFELVFYGWKEGAALMARTRVQKACLRAAVPATQTVSCCSQYSTRVLNSLAGCHLPR